MGRQRKQSAYDSEKIMKKLMDAVTESYEETGELKIMVEEFSMSAYAYCSGIASDRVAVSNIDVEAVIRKLKGE